MTGLSLSAPAATREEAALDRNQSFSISTGLATVQGSEHLVLYVSNPVGSLFALRFRHRLYTASRADTLIPVGPPFGGIANPVAPIPANVATIGVLGDGPAPVVTGRFGVATTANLPTGTATPGNLAGGGALDLEFGRKLMPGRAFASYMTNTSNAGLGGAFPILMAITMQFYLEPI